jgi:hypothetical protein
MYPITYLVYDWNDWNSLVLFGNIMEISCAVAMVLPQAPGVAPPEALERARGG